MSVAPPKSGWQEIGKAAPHPCAGCGKRDGFCSYKPDPKGDVCICRRASAGPKRVPQKNAPDAFMFPYGTADQIAAPMKMGKPAPAKAKLGETALKAILKEHQRAMASDRLAAEAAALGLAPESLRAYGVGYDANRGTRGSLTFPMYDGGGKLIGIRTRSCDPNDAKRQACVPGSANGLFVPADFDPVVKPDPLPDTDEFAPLFLLMPEGPTDAAAAWQCGFQAIGRPNCSTGGDFVRALLQRCRQAGAARDAVVVADDDAVHWAADHSPYWPGWEGAVWIAGSCVGPAQSVRVILPPRGKDLRAALNAMDAKALGTALIVRIGEAVPVTQAWLATEHRRIDAIKEICRRTLGGRMWGSADPASPDARRRALAHAEYLWGHNEALKWLAATEPRKAG